MSDILSGVGNPQIVSGASGRGSRGQKLSNLFNQIDTQKTGSVSKTQFQSAFDSLNLPPALKSMGADALFAKLDPKGTGSVSMQNFVNGMKQAFHQTRQSGARSINSNSGGIQASSLSATLMSGFDALQAALDTNSSGSKQTNTLGFNTVA